MSTIASSLSSQCSELRMATSKLQDALRCGIPMVLLLIIVIHIRSLQSQVARYGDPPYCLLSRTEVINCPFKFPNRAQRTTFNQQGYYETRYRRSGSGPPRCEILNRRQRVENIPTFPGDDRLKFIFSPGKQLEPPQPYGNQIYVLYNISCPPNHLAFFDLTEIDLEGPNCYDENTNQMQCIDYVRVIRDPYGNTESCGNEIVNQDDQSQFQNGSFSILFRTSQSGRYAGFQANIICFDSGTRDQPGCTRPDTDGNPVVDNANSGRRKRDTGFEEFENMWKSHLARVRRMRRQVSAVISRFETINVPFGVDVLYSDKTLRFILRDGGMEFTEISPVQDIIFLVTFDTNEMLTTFKGEAANLALGGPGPLRIIGNYAYFQLFIINTRGLTPTPEEMVAIGDLTMAQYTLVTEDNATRRTEEELNPACSDPFADLGQQPISGVTLPPECPTPMPRGKRQTAQTMSSMLDDSAIITAIRNENACNPVLLASAMATIKLVIMDDRERYERLKAEITSSTDSPTTMVPP